MKLILILLFALSPALAEAAKKTFVTASGAKFNLRAQPSISGSVVATAPSGSSLEVLERNGDWLKVEFNGVQAWVSSKNPNPASAPQPAPAPAAPSSSSADCAGANCNVEKKPAPNEAVDQISKISRDLSSKTGPDPVAPEKPATPPAAASTWLDNLRKLMKNPKTKVAGLSTSRGLVQMPLLGSRGNIGACGSHHYNPDKPIGVDAYANPVTACVLTSVMQEWKKNVCPERSGCTLAWGDISHKTDPAFHGSHQTHTKGLCVDIRPMRKGGFEDKPLYYNYSDYDRNMTTKLVKLLRANGADTSRLYFNDPKVTKAGLSRRSTPEHANHVHVCFNDNAKTRAVCNNLKVDTNVCPELR